MITLRKQFNVVTLALVLAAALLSAAAPRASAGSYIVAQCAPGLFQDAPEAGYATTSEHFTAVKDCGPEQPGVQVGHVLVGGATGTEQGRYGRWVWQAPAGTYITGGSVYSRLATENGIHGYLSVSADSGESVATENQNDDQLHLSAIPAGQWRFFTSTLACTVPNEAGRCAGATPNAHAWVKQLRIQVTDAVPPTISTGGSMFSGATLRGPQTISVAAADQGSGVAALAVTVNGSEAAGDDLGASCNLLPGNLASRLSPCPSSISRTYTLNTEAAPFHDGANTVAVCAFDYAQDGKANPACASAQVSVDAVCPASPRAGGAKVTAGFGNGKPNRRLTFGRRALIRGRVLDAAGSGVEGAQVCILGHTLGSNRPNHLIGTVVTNQAGGWSAKLHKGPSREIIAAYRTGATQIEKAMTLHVRARAILHVSTATTKPHRNVFFFGRLLGPRSAHRNVILKGSVRGARRVFLVRQGRTDALGRYKMRYRFARIGVRAAKFVFKLFIPKQAEYGFDPGRSAPQFVVVT
jgi:hypothetical protein